MAIYLYSVYNFWNFGMPLIPMRMCLVHAKQFGVIAASARWKVTRNIKHKETIFILKYLWWQLSLHDANVPEIKCLMKCSYYCLPSPVHTDYASFYCAWLVSQILYDAQNVCVCVILTTFLFSTPRNKKWSKSTKQNALFTA